jgi:transposase, IS30 family
MRGVLMTRRGRKRQLDAGSLYWQLILSGVGTAEACREVGIGRKTGYRWRAENGGLPPDRLAEEARSGRYLSLLERQRSHANDPVLDGYSFVGADGRPLS